MRAAPRTMNWVKVLWSSFAFVFAGICLWVITYLASARALLLDGASERLSLVVEQGFEEYKDLVEQVESWGELIERRYTFLLLRGEQALGASVAGLLVDMIDQHPALEGVVLTDKDGTVLYSTDGPPGAYPAGFSMNTPMLEPGVLHALGSAKVGFGVLEGQELFQFWTVIASPTEKPIKVGFLVSNHQISHIRSSAELTQHISVQFISAPTQAVAEKTRNLPYGYEREVFVSGISGFLGLRYELDVAALLREGWLPKVLWLGGLTLLAGLIGAGLIWIIARMERAHRRSRNVALQSREWLQAVLASASDAILIVDESQTIVAVNEAVEDVFGWRPEDIRGKALANLLSEESHVVHPRLVASFFSKGKSLTRMGDFRRVRALRKDGQTFPVMISLGFAEVDGARYAIAVARDMTLVEEANQQLVSLTTELSTQLDAAQAANHAKTLFLANVSHELRTPLNAIIGFSEVIHYDLLGKGASAEYGEYAGDILQAGRHLQDLIENVLDFARLDAGKQPINLDSFTVDQVWALPIENLTIVARGSGVRLIHDAVLGHEVVRADLRAIRQCLFNVVGNAIKFSPQGGRVLSWTEVDGNSLIFAVSDEGPGIPAKEMPRLMKPFEQIGDPYQAETKGAGLGLAITKQLVDLMGGELTFDSKEGEGTTVRIRLPKSARGV